MAAYVLSPRAQADIEEVWNYTVAWILVGTSDAWSIRVYRKGHGVPGCPDPQSSAGLKGNSRPSRAKARGRQAARLELPSSPAEGS